MSVGSWSLTIIGIYFAGVMGMWLFDVFIGFDEPEVEQASMDAGKDYVGLFFLWPLLFPIALFFKTMDGLRNVKRKRVAKALQIRKIRIAEEAEDRKLLEEIEKEMEAETKQIGKDT